MEGAYGKIFAARASVPTPDYAHLMDMLAETVRDEIAACAEKAYTTLSRAAAAKLVGVSEAEMTSLAEARGWRLDATGGVRVQGGGGGAVREGHPVHGAHQPDVVVRQGAGAHRVRGYPARRDYGRRDF